MAEIPSRCNWFVGDKPVSIFKNKNKEGVLVLLASEAKYKAKIIIVKLH